MGKHTNLATWRMSPRVSASFRRYESFGKRIVFARGEILYTQGETEDLFYFIDSGFVRISILHEEGQEVLLEVMGPDTLCGEGACFDGMPRFSTAQAMSQVSAVAFRRNDIQEMLRTDPEFGMDLLGVVAEKARIVAVKVGIAPLSTEQRIMEFLTRQATMFGEDSAQGCVIRTALTHEQIAAMTGCSRVTVTRTLLKLRASHVIEQIDGYYVLPQRWPVTSAP